MNGNDHCEAGHVYPSCDAVDAPKGSTAEIPAFSFLNRDAKAVASQLLRAGWTRDRVVNVSIDIGAWKIALVDAFCAAEEAGKDGE